MQLPLVAGLRTRAGEALREMAGPDPSRGDHKRVRYWLRSRFPGRKRHGSLRGKHAKGEALLQVQFDRRT